ncbi:MAG TPA: hypothetical protein VGN55_13000 [Xanthobacteraceae bacterium]|jgi:hypothetical protein
MTKTVMTGIVQRTAERRGQCLLGPAAGLMMCALATIARAEVHIDGNPAAVRVTTSQDAISDVLLAIGANFNVRYRTAIPLDAVADTSYSGSVGQVISRLLDGYNYVIKTDQKSTEIVIFGRNGQAASPAPASKAPAPKGILSQWR